MNGRERTTRAYRYLFGPVPSRRFGRSLGIDLTPRKTCSLNCVFCQLGPTAHPTLERREYVPTSAVLDELRAWLDTGEPADVLTLAGSGEPTLHTGFGDVLAFLAEHTSTPSLLLTNGTTMHLPVVREAAARASIVKLSLGAWDQASFERLNRPHPGLEWSRIVEGYRAFRSRFCGDLRLEVFVVAGINDAPDAMRRIAALARTVRPDRVQLNTAVRPPADRGVRPVTAASLDALARLFTPPAETIGEFSVGDNAGIAADENTILDMIRRRPATPTQMADVFGLHPNEVAKYLGRLSRNGRVDVEDRDGEPYYVALP